MRPLSIYNQKNPHNQKSWNSIDQSILIRKNLEEDVEEMMHLVLLEIPEMTDATIEMTGTLGAEKSLQL